MKPNRDAPILAADPDSPGSLGIAISEAVEAAVRSDDSHYTLGSVLNHVMLHQTVIGLEVERQMAEMEDSPDIMIACCGGGSNFAGLTFPFMPQKLKGKEIRFVACRALFVSHDEPRPVPVRLRRHDEVDAVDQDVHAGTQFRAARHSCRWFAVSRHVADGQPGSQTGDCRSRLLSPARVLRGSAAVRGHRRHDSRARDVARHSRRDRGSRSAAARKVPRKCIVFNLSGHGLCDLGAYDRFFSGELEDYEYPQERIEAAIAELPDLDDF